MTLWGNHVWVTPVNLSDIHSSTWHHDSWSMNYFMCRRSISDLCNDPQTQAKLFFPTLNSDERSIHVLLNQSLKACLDIKKRYTIRHGFS